MAGKEERGLGGWQEVPAEKEQGSIMWASGLCEPLAFLESDESHWKVLKTGGTQPHIHGSLRLLGLDDKQSTVKRGRLQQ